MKLYVWNWTTGEFEPDDIDEIIASLSEPDNLKQTNDGKETDRGPGLSGSEREAGLGIAEVEYHTFECGHGEIAVKGGRYRHLCPKCDDAMADGHLDEEGRYKKWLRRQNASQDSSL